MYKRQTQRSYVDKLLTALLGEDKLNNLSSYLYYGNSSKYWSVQSILNTGNVDKLPNMPLYVIVILGYIILVGPGPVSYTHLLGGDREISLFKYC